VKVMRIHVFDLVGGVLTETDICSSCRFDWLKGKKLWRSYQCRTATKAMETGGG